MIVNRKIIKLEKINIIKLILLKEINIILSNIFYILKCDSNLIFFS